MNSAHAAKIAGSDALTGGSGADRFVVAAADGNVITDFEDGVDRINITASGIAFGDLGIEDASAQGGNMGDARISRGSGNPVILADFDRMILANADFIL